MQEHDSKKCYPRAAVSTLCRRLDKDKGNFRQKQSYIKRFNEESLSINYFYDKRVDNQLVSDFWCFSISLCRRVGVGDIPASHLSSALQLVANFRAHCCFAGANPLLACLYACVHSRARSRMCGCEHQVNTISFVDRILVYSKTLLFLSRMERVNATERVG